MSIIIHPAFAAETIPGEAAPASDTVLFYGALIFLVLVVAAFFLWLRAVKK